MLLKMFALLKELNQLKTFLACTLKTFQVILLKLEYCFGFSMILLTLFVPVLYWTCHNTDLLLNSNVSKLNIKIVFNIH